MRFSEIVLAGVTDVDDVCDAKSFDDVGVTSVVIIAQEEAARENLVWIVLSNRSVQKLKILLKRK